MITLRDAEHVASAWARRESLRRGHRCAPMVSEFDIGYVVWMREPAGDLPSPGDSVSTVIDKETGRVSTWPRLPSAVIKDMYRRRRTDVVAPTLTADPAFELLRTARRRPTPTVAARLSVRYRPFVGRGAKGDQELRHHRLVRRALAEIEVGALDRGAERHAELVAVSDVLHTFDSDRAQQGLPPLTDDEAGALLADAQLEALHVREPGDPLGGAPAVTCWSCRRTLARLGVAAAGAAKESERAGEPTRAGLSEDDALGVLRDAGWTGPPGADQARQWIDTVCAVGGLERRHEVFPAASQALTRFGGLTSDRHGPGERRRVRPVRLDAAAAAHTADQLGEFAVLIGARLFPIGVEGAAEAVLAVDERSRVFAIDQAGEWFVGGSVEAALATLLTGGPVARVHDDGSWL
ncbi:SUKH-3 domain-containing protein [Pilimelia columellifera]|uniref:Uncharacterized protein n=1 Tax=Pilimelia columellifera subsp. columellifera TaxID=706583 RepID=A0ABN3NK74_9ACTN